MATDLKTVLKLRVPIIVQIGDRNVPLEDVLAMGPGAILEMDKSSDANLALLVNNKPIGQGEAVKIIENFGLRITEIGSAAERVEALGG